MGIGFSIFLIAVGAILRYAISYRVEGVNLPMVGLILMVVGAIGAVLSLLFWSSVAPFSRRRDIDAPV